MPAVRKLEHYVREMADGGKISEYGNRTKVQNDLSRIYKLIKQQHKTLQERLSSRSSPFTAMSSAPWP